MKKFVNYIRENWSATLFALVYVFAFCGSLAFSIAATQPNGVFNPLLSISLLIASVSLCAILGKVFIKAIFKEDADSISKKTSTTLIAILLFFVVYTVISLLLTFKLPLIDELNLDGSDFAPLLNAFIIPIYIFAVSFYILLLFALSFAAFWLLRLTVKHSKIVLILFILSAILAGVIYSGIAFQKHDRYRETICI